MQRYFRWSTIIYPLHTTQRGWPVYNRQNNINLRYENALTARTATSVRFDCISYSNNNEQFNVTDNNSADVVKFWSENFFQPLII